MGESFQYIKQFRLALASYELALQAADISVGDVVRAVEGPVAVVHCALEDDETVCNRIDRCVAHLMWQQLSEVMTEFLDSVTLQDLCDQARALGREGA